METPYETPSPLKWLEEKFAQAGLGLDPPRVSDERARARRALLEFFPSGSLGSPMIKAVNHRHQAKRAISPEQRRQADAELALAWAAMHESSVGAETLAQLVTFYADACKANDRNYHSDKGIDYYPALGRQFFNVAKEALSLEAKSPRRPGGQAL